MMFETEKMNIFDDINEFVDKSDSSFCSTFCVSWFVDGTFLRAISRTICVIGHKRDHSYQQSYHSRYFNRQLQCSIRSAGEVSGPCHAEEVALERLSILPLPVRIQKHAETFAKNLECRYIKTVISNDIYGIEYAAVLKNLIALATGFAWSGIWR
jgi:glycerol-3-phosphate dehydrogenase (NAD(P)+)